MDKINYGFDAPAIMRSLIIAGILVPIIGLLIPYFTDIPLLKYISFLIIFIGLILLVLGSSMYFYGIKGKFLMRDFMLKKIN